MFCIRASKTFAPVLLWRLKYHQNLKPTLILWLFFIIPEFAVKIVILLFSVSHYYYVNFYFSLRLIHMKFDHIYLFIVPCTCAPHLLLILLFLYNSIVFFFSVFFPTIIYSECKKITKHQNVGVDKSINHLKFNKKNKSKKILESIRKI